MEPPKSTDELLETIKKLQHALDDEKDKNRKLIAELKTTKQDQITSQAAAEAEEEYITNKLMKNLMEIKKEKDQLALQVEQEEEYLTNTLQKKLIQLKQEKVDLENQLEQEEEYIVNKLRKELEKIQHEKDVLEKKLDEERELHDKYKTMQKELDEARQRIVTYKDEFENTEKKNLALKEKLKRLKTDNFVLEQKITREHSKLQEITTEKMYLERGAEIDLERQFTEWWHGSTPPSVSASSPSLVSGTKPITIVTGPHSPSKSRPNTTARMHRTRSMSAPRHTHTAIAGTSPRTSGVPSFVPPIPLKPVHDQMHSSLSPKSSPRAISGSSSAHKRNKSQSGIGAMLGSSPGTKLQSKVLIKGWMAYQTDSDATRETLLFMLHDNGLLEGYEAPAMELVPLDLQFPVVTINMDTVGEVHCSKNVLTLLAHGHDTVAHFLKCEASHETAAWYELLLQILPTSTTTSSASGTSSLRSSGKSDISK